MTLDTFLTDSAQLTAVELLPDDRLINVIVGDGALYGIQVANIPLNASVTRIAANYVAPVITAGALTFNAPDYVMLDDLTVVMPQS